MTRTVLSLAAAGEAATGLVLLAYPPIVVRLLFGAEVAGAGMVVSRFAGVALVALGIACWPGGASAHALCGMLTYSALATLYFLWLGVGGEWVGKLLWPAVAAHGVLTILLLWAWFNPPKTTAAKGPISQDSTTTQ
jgi:hypothetical protein